MNANPPANTQRKRTSMEPASGSCPLGESLAIGVRHRASRIAEDAAEQASILAGRSSARPSDPLRQARPRGTRRVDARARGSRAGGRAAAARSGRRRPPRAPRRKRRRAPKVGELRKFRAASRKWEKSRAAAREKRRSARSALSLSRDTRRDAVAQPGGRRSGACRWVGGPSLRGCPWAAGFRGRRAADLGDRILRMTRTHVRIRRGLQHAERLRFDAGARRGAERLRLREQQRADLRIRRSRRDASVWRRRGEFRPASRQPRRSSPCFPTHKPVEKKVSTGFREAPRWRLELRRRGGQTPQPGR